MKRIIAFVLGCLIMSGILSGCSSKEVFNIYTDNAEAAGFPVTVYDLRDKEFEFKAVPESIVCTDFTALMSVAEAGGIDSVSAYLGDIKGDLLPILRGDIESVSGEIPENAQMILCTGENISEYESYEKSYLMFEVENFIDFYTNLLELSVLFGRNWDSRSIALNELEAKIASIIRRVTIAERSRVMFLGEESMYMTLPASSPGIVNEIITKAGGVNAVTDEKEDEMLLDFSSEDIEKWDPEVIWVPYFAGYSVEDVVNNPDFANTAAVKNGKVYVFPGALEPWYEKTIGAYIGMCWAVYNLHPQLYSFEELVGDANSVYELLYGMTFTAEEMGIKNNEG